MQQFSREFLTQLASEYNLSPEQTEAFIAYFSCDLDKCKVAQNLSISESALGTRMSGVYRKFSIGGKGSKKRQALHKWLSRKYQNLNSSEPPASANQKTDIDELVRQVRETIKPLIQARCGIMRVLDMNQPISLGSIYTHVNVLEQIPSRKRLRLAQLLQDMSPQTFERFSLGTIKETLSGLKAVEKYRKLVILGKPGSGKTTFLKHLAIQCLGGVFQPHCVPLFITLKDFAEIEGQLDLLAYFNSLIVPTKETNEHSSPSTNRLTQEILQNGHALILLDGLDEVQTSDIQRVLRQIQYFSESYPRNIFVITCRIAAHEYTLEQFTEVEIDDFNDEQIADFVNKWFCSKQQAGKAEEFLQQLKCEPRIRNLAIRPLLLTLLCLVFEDSGFFSTQHWKLYRDGFKALLKCHAQIADTIQEPFYRVLSSSGREALFRQIAFPTFEQGNYFFDLDTAERLIKQILPNCLSPNKDNLEIEDLNIEPFLAAIESQHGILIERAHEIYSFSHLAFHEYFTARHIVETSHQSQSLKTLASHFTEDRWHEVVFLTLEMLQPADDLLILMKQQADELLAGDEKLQLFLYWIDDKAKSMNARYKLVAIRALYFTIACTPNPTFNLNPDPDPFRMNDFDLVLELDANLTRTLAFGLDLNFNPDLSCNHDLDLTLAFDLVLNLVLTLALNHGLYHDLSFTQGLSFNSILDLLADGVHTVSHKLKRPPDSISNLASTVKSHDYNFALAVNRTLTIDCISLPELQYKLQEIKDCFPATAQENWETFRQWWQTNKQTWTEQFQTMMIQYRNIGHDWQFSEAQKQQLEQYSYANKILIVCLDTQNVSDSLRQEVEASLLLPLMFMTSEGEGKDRHLESK